jgi:hypothetical protein
MLDEVVVPYLQLYPSIYLEELRQNHSYLCDRELNPLTSDILTIMNYVWGYVLKEVITAYYTLIPGYS